MTDVDSTKQEPEADHSAFFLHRYAAYEPGNDIALADNLYETLNRAIGVCHLIVAADVTDSHDVPEGTIHKAAQSVIGDIEDALVILNEWHKTKKLEKEHKPSIDYAGIDHMIQTGKVIENFVGQWQEMMNQVRVIDREMEKSAKKEMSRERKRKQTHNRKPRAGGGK